MADAVIGKTYTFQVLFVDALNQPVVVADATITLFNFLAGGIKNVLVQAPMVTVTPAENGRYVYEYLVPTTFQHGDLIHAEMTATDPGNPANRLLTEEQITVVEVGATVPGLVARFVQGG